MRATSIDHVDHAIFPGARVMVTDWEGPYPFLQLQDDGESREGEGEREDEEKTAYGKGDWSREGTSS